MANKRIDYVIGFNADTSKLSNALKQLEGQLNNIASGKTKFISDATTKDITNVFEKATANTSYLFPTTAEIGSPELAATNLYEGRIVILINNLPIAIVLPVDITYFKYWSFTLSKAPILYL